MDGRRYRRQCYLLLEEAGVLSQKFFEDDLGNECYLINYIIWCMARGWTCASFNLCIISWHVVVQKCSYKILITLNFI